MTAQLNDVVFFRGANYSLVGVCADRGGLFNPAEHGLEPVWATTACWRGYVAAYAISDGSLVLRNLTVSLEDSVPPPLLFGMPPRKKDGRTFRYEALDAPVAFSGGLLVGGKFIDSLYVHMGFHPAWKYAEVWELVLEDGRVTGEFDRSAEVRAKREHLTATPLSPVSGSGREDVEAWISTCFSREYKR